MMIYHNTKFDNKMFGSLEYIIWTNTDILTLHCDLALECSTLIFPQDTLSYDRLSLDHIWLPKNQQFRRYSSHILIVWALAVTLTLKTANKFSAWHSALWSYITVPSWVKNGWAVQGILSRQNQIQRQDDRQINRQMDRGNPIYIPPHGGWVGGEYKNQLGVQNIFFKMYTCSL